VNRRRSALAAFWVFAGAMHFIRPRAYEATVPDYIPISAADAVSWSGAAEIAGGLAVAPAATRRFGRWWLTGLLIAIFPANVHMALEPEQVAARGVPVDRLPRWLLFARLPVQALFILWAWRATE
jgi:uncharacterized membrane protein